MLTIDPWKTKNGGQLNAWFPQRSACALRYPSSFDTISAVIESTGCLPVTNLPTCGKVVPGETGDEASSEGCRQRQQARGPRSRGPFVLLGRTARSPS
ncbi:MAG: hypothetical protein HXY24_09220 [Rubrivivax sp.]|nr:hypothetical protein [Rubrivivax sp.]